jgi:ferredoxin
MAFVVCEPCYDCKYTDCVTQCPMDCFYQDDMMLYIDPDECIDCEACVSMCPVGAIYRDAEVPPQWTQYVQLNLERTRALKAQGGDAAHCTERQEPLEGPACKKAR